MKLLKPFVPAQAIVQIEQPPEETAEEIIAKKEQFAELSMREENPFKVALLVYPNDTGKALRISKEWPGDPDVVTFVQSFKEAAEEFEFHPTKEQFARKLLNNAELMLTIDPQTAHRYHESYRKMRWPDSNVQINDNRMVNNIMVIKDHGNAEQWEAKTLAQQRRLKAESVVSTVEKTN